MPSPAPTGPGAQWPQGTCRGHRPPAPAFPFTTPAPSLLVSLSESIEAPSPGPQHPARVDTRVVLPWAGQDLTYLPTSPLMGEETEA